MYRIEDLKAMPIWLLWVKQWKKGKITKVPISAAGGPSGTDEKYKHTLVLYEEAVTAKDKIHADGIGLVLPDGFFLLDKDHVDMESPLVKLLRARFRTYTEKSPSGNGFHMLGYCDISKLPTHYDEKKQHNVINQEFYQKNSKIDLELYIGGLTNRYATFTGDIIEDLELADCTEAVLTTLDKEMRRKPKVKYSAKRDGDRETFDIICDLRKQKNNQKFIALFDNGDFSSYGSQSEADCALCALIAFRVGPDPEAIDEIFRESALYREKWERDDYRTMTIEKGIEACRGNYHYSQMPHPSFIKMTDKGPVVSVPLLAQAVRDTIDYVLVRDNGKQATLKYVYEDGCYRYYADNMMMGLIKQLVADYDLELVKMGQISEALAHINTDLNYVGQEAMDSNENIINFQNGLLYLNGEEPDLREHSPEVLSTIQIPCDWTGEDKPTPVFDAYLHTLTDGDEEIKQLLLEWIGVCISNLKGWRMKKALFMVGNGDTGKSQLKSLVERLLGKGNYIGIDLKDIEAHFGTGSIYGTRLAGSSDMSFLSVGELKTFKMLTGGDSVQVEFKGLQSFETTYNGLLWFCMNKLPKFGGDDGQWVYDRIMVVNCPNVIPRAQQDKQLLDKMYAERDGIIYKAVMALRTVIANGYRFSEPKSVALAREEYQCTNSTVISFFKECMGPWEDGKINRYCTTGRIYKVYQAWCKENNNGYAKTAKEFREQLADHLGTTTTELITRQKGNSYYRNYSLSQEAKEMYQREYGYDGSDFLDG